VFVRFSPSGNGLCPRREPRTKSWLHFAKLVREFERREVLPKPIMRLELVARILFVEETALTTAQHPQRQNDGK
jgi:hypothetical protein